MLINILLLFIVFGALVKKKLKPLQAGLILGGIKAAIILFFSRSIVDALLIGIIFALLGTGLMFLLNRISKKPITPVDPAKMYSSSEKSKFHWEYIPITVVILIILGGELFFIL